MLSLCLKKSFARPGQPFTLNASFSVPAELGRAVLFGPSGSGKTLSMQCLAGLARPDSGHIELCGQTLFDSAAKINLPPQGRRLGYMPQDYALFPHLTLLQNVAYPRSGPLGRLIKPEERERALAQLERLELAGLAGRYPSELSGGQKQRAALARALNAEPACLLLDEPFSALDPLLRVRLRSELKELLDSLDLPALIISHDPEDVDTFAGALILYARGRALPVADYAAKRAHFANASDCLITLSTEWEAQGWPAEGACRQN